MAEFALLKYTFPDQTSVYIDPYTVFKLQIVKAPTTAIQPTTASNFHCFGHVIYTPQTIAYYQNIAKL